MGDTNPISTLGDYSRPSHEGYMNTIELPDGNNVVPLRSDTIRRPAMLNPNLQLDQRYHDMSRAAGQTGKPEEEEQEEKDDLENINTNPSLPHDPLVSFITEKVQNRENGRMIFNSLQNGPLVWPTVEENGTTRTKKYVELSVAEKLQADCDLNATNIILQGLPPDVYVIVNHHKVCKDIWDRVKLLMQGMKLSLQEKECEGHMARQCTQPKRTRNAAWFKEKAMLAEAHEAGQIFDEVQLVFLADPGIPDGQTA
nr:integrase, catalytic region, zinc finger, CCHC-type, peptidase aspartic, catalytic [Tanacetum cinerariifolium]